MMRSTSTRGPALATLFVFAVTFAAAVRAQVPVEVQNLSW